MDADQTNLADTADRHHGKTADSLDVIEKATAMLARNLELLRRRSDVYTELDRAEYLLLRTLEQMGPVDICTLATELGLDSSTAGRQLAGMQAKGLVKRTPAPADRRCTLVSATDKGRDRMVMTRARCRENTSRLLSGWSEDDLRTLGEMFTRYNQAVADHYLDLEREINRPGTRYRRSPRSRATLQR